MAEMQTYLFGKKFPNRIFVGGLPVDTQAYELAEFFTFFGHVTESKIILDQSGISKGYGFVTFENTSSVKHIESMGIIYFKNKKINIGPAVKKESPNVEPELVILPRNKPMMIPQQQNNAVPAYNTVMDGVGNHVYQQLQQQYIQQQSLQQPQQPTYYPESFIAADNYGYYLVTKDGVFRIAYPNYSTPLNQNCPPFSPPVRDGRSGSASSGGSSDDEVKITNGTGKRYHQRKDLPPRFMRK